MSPWRRHARAGEFRHRLRDTHGVRVNGRAASGVTRGDNPHTPERACTRPPPLQPMARLIPDEIDAAALRGHARRELETLTHLEDALPDTFVVYHGVHWARADERVALHGEIDFIVANPLGRLIAIEQKTGSLEAGETDLIKTYATGARGVRSQLERNLGHLMGEFARRHPGRRLDVDHLLYLPDHRMTGPTPSAIDPDRVVDARDRDRLGARVLELFAQREIPSSSRDSRGAPPPDALDVHAFLCDLAQAEPSVDAISALARRHYRRLSGGLATWARRLEVQPQRLRVVGTAGSGKTQLALEELRAAHTAGKRALYLCFNRTLADAMRQAVPVPQNCMTFHELGAQVLRAKDTEIDYTAPGVFDCLARAVIDATPQMADTLDLLIVDEGQDFMPDWGAAIVAWVRAAGRALWLEDPSQNLYRRDPAALAGWAVLRSPVNLRSPHVVVTIINLLGLVDTPLEAGGAVHGFDPELYEYDDGDDPRAQTTAAVTHLLRAGHAPEDIAVISWHGSARSRLVSADRIADVATRRFTGRFTDEGEALMTDGALRLETLFRFKGQAADCIVLTEIDFNDWDEDVGRRLFVGLTRARLRVNLVASRSAARHLTERLSGDASP